MTTLLKAMTKGTGNGITWNGSISYDTTMSNLLNYFAKVGTYQGRDQSEVDFDMLSIFTENEEIALRLVFASRLVTRKPNDVEGVEDTQTGFGRKDEFYKALKWLKENRPALLEKNLHLIPVFGSWKDFVNEPLIDVLDREMVYRLFSENLDNGLLRKYLPQMRSGKSVRTPRDGKRSEWAKGFAKFLGLSPKDYRKLKAQGTAHIFQKQMSAGHWDKINFNGIPGRAMTQMISRHGKDKQNVFERHGLVQRLTDWVLTQKNVKFNGYPYELTQAACYTKNPNAIQKIIYNKQFETVLERIGQTSLGNTLCALDTSASMTCNVVPGISAYDICISMGLVFSSLNVGYFKDHVVAFDNTSRLISLKGNFVERLHQIQKMETAWGSTNFQSVIDLLVRTRLQNPEIPLAEYPETLLIISDMQFNVAGNNTQTNYEVAMQKLRAVGLQDIRIIWWYVNGQGKDFPSQMDDKGVYIVGGFDPVVLKALLGLTSTEAIKAAEVAGSATAVVKEQNPLDGMMNVLNQPIFSLVQT